MKRRIRRPSTSLFVGAVALLATACSSSSGSPLPEGAIAEATQALSPTSGTLSPFTTPATVTDAVNGYAARAQAFLEQRACAGRAENRDIRAGSSVMFPGREWSATALAMIAYEGVCNGTETRADRIRMLDSALVYLHTRGQLLGTTIEPTAGYARQGELDTALQDLIPLLLQFGSLLDPTTRASLQAFIASVDSGPYDSSYHSIDVLSSKFMPWTQMLLKLVDPMAMISSLLVEFVEIPETENHLLLIYSTRFLINERLAATNPSGAYDNATNGMRDYWLRRLQSILKNDFQEYNARPYAGYSLDAIENLAELAQDPDIKTAATAVLDYMSAKFATAASLDRRNSPFRRLVAHGGPKFFQDWDEQACRFALYAGTNDLLIPPSRQTGTAQLAVPSGCELVSRQASGSYRVPPMILELAINKMGHPYFQTHSNGTNDFHHAPGGVEIYDNEGPFTIAAGGIPLKSGVDGVLHLLAGESPPIANWNAEDRGLALPTVLMPNFAFPEGDARNAVNRLDLVRFEGTQRSDAVNTCVAPGFACGLNPIIPESFCPGGAESGREGLGQFCPGEDGHWLFLDFSNGTNPNGFYVAVWKSMTENSPKVPVGFLEGARASDFGFSFETFKLRVKGLNGGDGAAAGHARFDTNSNIQFDINYQSVRGGTIVAHLHQSVGGPYDQPPAFAREYPVQSAFAFAPDQNTDNWALANGPIASVGHTGSVNITVTGYGTCRLDLSDAMHPRRTGECDNLPSNYHPPAAPVFQWTPMHVNPATGNVFPPMRYEVTSDVISGAEYLCRAPYAGGQQLGRVQNGPCVLWEGGAAVEVFDFQILTYVAHSSDTSAPSWVSGPMVPENAFVGGNEADGRPLYVCRASYGLASYPGKVVGSGCSVVVGTQEMSVSTFEVLGVIPVDASTGGGGSGGSGGGYHPPPTKGGCGTRCT